MTGGSSVQVVNRERLSGKVHATIPKGIVGGFEGTVLQRNREATDICLRVLKESNKSRFDEVRQLQSFDHIPYYLSGLPRAHLFRQPFSKVLAPLSLSRNAGREGPGTCDIMFHSVLTESMRFPAAMRRGSF